MRRQHNGAESEGIVSPLALIGGRVRHVEEVCRHFAHESVNGTGTFTDRAVLAQTVLSVLAGNADQPIRQEILARREPLAERVIRSHLRPVD
jgi:hypothetical protein